MHSLSISITPLCTLILTPVQLTFLLFPVLSSLSLSFRSLFNYFDQTLLTKDDHIATSFLDGVLSTDSTRARVIVLNGEDLDQVGILELCNCLLSSGRRLRVRRQRRLTRVLLVGTQSLRKSKTMMMILVVTERVD